MCELTFDAVKQLLEATIGKQTQEIRAELLLIHETTDKKLKVIDEKLQNRCVYLERKIRKNNVVVFGLNDIKPDNNIAEATIGKINELLQTTYSLADVNNVYKTSNRKESPIVVEFTSFIKKSHIFRDKERLKGLKAFGVSVANDLCREDREEQKILLQHFKQAKKDNIPAKLRGRRLEIDGQLYTASQLLKRHPENEYGTHTSDAGDEESEAGDLTGDRQPGTFLPGRSQQKTNVAKENRGLEGFGKPTVVAPRRKKR